MLDRKFVVENVELVKKNCENRGVQADVDQVVALEAARKAKLQEAEEFNRQANEINKTVGKATPEERPNIIAEGKRLRQLKDDASTEVDKLEEQIVEILRIVPNLTHPDAPIGEDDKSNLEIQRGATEPRKFDFKVLDHVELGEKLDLIDFEAGAQVAGAGFYYLKNEAVLLELALQQYVVSLLVKEGFVPTITPDMARTEILHGVGFIPRGPETQIYSIEHTDLNLVATAEITLGGMYAGKTLEAETLPQLFCGISHCYRTEAGAAGRASRGLYRVHQFTKVEMFAFTLPEDSEATLTKFRDLECKIFDGLKIPYRVVDTATGDLGGPAYRKFDLEAWMPGRGEAGEYGEVTSTSNCTDYQARRLNIRYKVKGEKGTHFAHTLNGTAIALSRGLIAVLENYQQADGSIEVPEVLRPYMGMDKIGPRQVMLRYAPYVLSAVVAINFAMWIVGKTPAVEFIDEAIPIGERGMVPGGRRPAGISRLMAPVQHVSWAIMTFTWPHPLIGVLSMTLEFGVLTGLCLLFENASRGSSGTRQRVPSWTKPDDESNPYDSPGK